MSSRAAPPQGMFAAAQTTRGPMRALPPRLLLLALLHAACGRSGPGPGAAPASQDATAFLEEAIRTAQGGTVTLAGSGTYSVRSVAVNIPGTTIVCTGTPTPATIQLRALGAGDGAPVFDVSADGFTLRNCILDGRRSAQPPGGFNDSFDGRAFRSAIRMQGRHRGLTVDGVTFKNVYGAAIATRDVSGIAVTHSTFQDDNFEAVFADNAFPLGDARDFLGGFTFTGNTVTNTGSRDVRVNANGLLVHQMTDVDIEGNVWTGYERSGIKLENCGRVTVAGNRIRDGAIPNFAAVTLQNGAHHVTVHDNDIGNVGTGIDTSLVAAGQYPSDSVVDVTIRTNTIRGVKPGDIPDGIRVLGYGPETQGIAIVGNTVQDVPRAGITLRQFRTSSPAPVFSTITVRDNHLTSAGSCADFFAGSDVAPTGVDVGGNRCD
jgi:hypothetical protein